MKNLLFISIIVFSGMGLSQTATMSLDHQKIRIGEQTVLNLNFEYENPKGDALIVWPEFDNNLNEAIEIIEKTIDKARLIDTLNGKYLREQKLVITAFEAGEFTIPAQEIRLGDSLYTTNLLELLVETVEVDTSKGITDIKPIYDVKYPFSERSKDWLKENWIWIALILAIIIGFIGYRYYQKKKPTTEEQEEPVIIIPAHITALKVLEQLLKNEEWKSSNKKGYYSDVTDTIRTYLEDRFEIYAMEETTREIINDLKNSPISDEDKHYLKKILSEADMVKFAKMTPTDENAFEMLSKSIDFVQRTKEKE